VRRIIAAWVARGKLQARPVSAVIMSPQSRRPLPAGADIRRRPGENRRSMSVSKIPDAAKQFWRRFEAETGIRATERFYGAGHFDDNESSANELAQLVLEEKKRATAGLLWAAEKDGTAPPSPGSLSIITNWSGRPICVIETTSVEIVPFGEVTEEFAAAEGEGDGSLSYWRATHWAYFERVCARIGRQVDRVMPVVCEHFKVIYREPEATSR
jgi:uncharacterized protein YhfF